MPGAPSVADKVMGSCPFAGVRPRGPLYTSYLAVLIYQGEVHRHDVSGSSIPHNVVCGVNAPRPPHTPVSRALVPCHWVQVFAC